jgi:hypothetical protein
VKCNVEVSMFRALFKLILLLFLAVLAGTFFMGW